MLLCSNIVVIMLLFRPIMLHFYTNNASAICQRTYIVGVKTWILKNIGTLYTNICWRWRPQYIEDASWFLLSLLQIDINAFRAFRRHNTIWWTWCHWHTCGTRAALTWYAMWPHQFFRKIPYYASIMPCFKSCWLCSKLCWHDILKPTSCLWQQQVTSRCLVVKICRIMVKIIWASVLSSFLMQLVSNPKVNLKTTVSSAGLQPGQPLWNN